MLPKNLFSTHLSLRTISISIVLLFMQGCQVQLVPQYSSELETQIVNAAKMSDKLYLDMMNDALAAKPSFDRYADKYIAVELEINSILLKNETRPKSGDIVASVQKLRDYFIKAMEDHKTKGTLSTGEMLIYNEQLKAFWKPVLIEEMALKKAR